MRQRAFPADKKSSKFLGRSTIVWPLACYTPQVRLTCFLPRNPPSPPIPHPYEPRSPRYR